jgi:hypothetical protein
MIGWGLFITLLLLVMGFWSGLFAEWGNAWGYPEKAPNWVIIWGIIIVMWIMIIFNKLGFRITR